MHSIATPNYQSSSNSNENHIVTKNKYDTPQKSKNEETAQKTLMKNVMERISSAKQSGSVKKNQLQRKINSKQILRPSQSRNNDDQMSQDKQLVLKNQSPNNPGFYQYVHWLKLHAQAFSYIQQKIVEEFWKILRLVNYGEVLIPTGLIYQIVIETKQGEAIGGFEKIINNFLAGNQTSDRIKSFKQIKNYSSLQEIQKQYKCIKEVVHQKNKRKKQFTSLNKHPSRSNSTSNVFERNFEEAKTRQVKKITQIYRGIISQQKQCYQKPKISIYKSQSFQSLIKPARICHNAQQHKWKSEQDKYLQQNNVIQNLFKAKTLDKSLFEGNIEQIPGVVSHLSRNHYSQAERLRLKRQAEKPQYSKKRIN